MQTVQTQLKDGRTAVTREETAGRQFAVAGVFHDPYPMGLEIGAESARNDVES